jgi:hypothetical protein
LSNAAGRSHGVHEPIDEPIPIISRLNGDPIEHQAIRLQRGEHEGEVIAEAFLIQDPVRIIDHDKDTVGGMESDARIPHHHRNLLGSGGCEPLRHARRSLYTPDKEPSR